jgi:hypothetical protein
VADYITKLREMDPDSLIIATSDHLPPLDGGFYTYENLGYTLHDEGEFRQNIWFYFGPEHQDLAWPDRDYQFMDFILDVLTKERICALIECKNRESVPLAKLTTSYNHIIAKGAGIAGEK